MSDDTRLDELLDQLKSDAPKTRRKAAEQLGKHGNPEAIIELSSVYRQEDEDQKVRDAAGKALRQFAAQASPPPRALRILVSLLTLSFMVLVAGNVVLRLGGVEGETEDVTAEFTDVPVASREALLDRLTQDIVANLGAINTLREDYNLGAGKLSCNTEVVKQPAEFTFSEAERLTYSDIAIVVDEMNRAYGFVNDAYLFWDSACAGAAKGTEGEISAGLDALSQGETILITAVDALTYLQENPPVESTSTPEAVEETPASAETPTPAVTDTPAATPSPTVTPMPTVDPTVLRDLERRISNGETAMNSLLNNNWLRVQSGEQSPFGCSVSPIDDDLTDVDPALLAAEPDLATAITDVNTALALARQSSTAYNTGCLNSSLTPAVISQGIADAQAALNAFQSAGSIVEDFNARAQ
ncbi:MAG TPA: HEAT repeat domain-containing protein [Aggregatilineales bacterium]|nr:HEAT repeat domain-containing protein [Aggregatilineales bacterium]